MKTYREFQEQRIEESPFKKAVSFLFKAREQLQWAAKTDHSLLADVEMLEKTYDYLMGKFKKTPEYEQIMNREL